MPALVMLFEEDKAGFSWAPTLPGVKSCQYGQSEVGKHPVSQYKVTDCLCAWKDAAKDTSNFTPYVSSLDDIAAVEAETHHRAIEYFSCVFETKVLILRRWR
ncbi:hypothetical protein GE09DRAFT_1219026 [Coniochaeta sp. 2T2.1]|nr:hypothetical protein GE09DRAFT_1219026 [Coniochaeta sp. 2T2.1]